MKAREKKLEKIDSIKKSINGYLVGKVNKRFWRKKKKIKKEKVGRTSRRKIKKKI